MANLPPVRCWDWMAMGRGVIDWAGQFRALKNDGYSFACTLETHWRGGGTPEESSRQSFAGMKRLLGKTERVFDCGVSRADQDRFALISKMHHCLSDGISGVDIATVLFDLERTPPDADASPKPWRPRPVPTIAETESV